MLTLLLARENCQDKGKEIIPAWRCPLSLALKGVERCFDREAEAASTTADLLDKLAMVIEADERDRRPAKTHRRTRDSYSSFSVVK